MRRQILHDQKENLNEMLTIYELHELVYERTKNIESAIHIFTLFDGSGEFPFIGSYQYNSRSQSRLIVNMVQIAVRAIRLWLHTNILSSSSHPESKFHFQ